MGYIHTTDDNTTVLDVDRLLSDLENENTMEDSHLEFMFPMDDDSDTEFNDSPLSVIDALIEEACDHNQVDQVEFFNRTADRWNLLEEELVFNAEVPVSVRIALLPMPHGGRLANLTPSKRYADYARNTIQDTIRQFVYEVCLNNTKLANNHLALLQHLSIHSVQTFSLQKHLEGNGAVLKHKLQRLDATNTEQCMQLISVLLMLEDHAQDSDAICWASVFESQNNREDTKAFYQTIFPLSSANFFKEEKTPPSLTSSPCSSIGSLSSNDTDTTRSSYSLSPPNKSATHLCHDNLIGGNLVIKPIPQAITTQTYDLPAAPQKTQAILINQNQKSPQPTLISSSGNSFTVFANKTKTVTLNTSISKRKSMPCI